MLQKLWATSEIGGPGGSCVALPPVNAGNVPEGTVRKFAPDVKGKGPTIDVEAVCGDCVMERGDMAACLRTAYRKQAFRQVVVPPVRAEPLQHGCEMPLSGEKRPELVAKLSEALLYEGSSEATVDGASAPSTFGWNRGNLNVTPTRTTRLHPGSQQHTGDTDLTQSNFSHHHVAAELDLAAPAPLLVAAETPAGQPWASIPANQPEDGPLNISAEQAVISQVVESRHRRRQKARGATTSKTPLNNSAKGDARAPSSSSKPPQKNYSPVSKWTPKPTVRMNPDDYVIVLKPRTTVALKATFQQGELGAAISQLIGRQQMNAITISPNWEQNIIVCGTQNPEIL
ncbi:hypothetical protein HPB49_024913 [Dermacentor silvarum]|uniref:Uncharacterized protein n=1 Tax=Dermacentor silvarum TaxID=543639 RepID=A0ACB8DH30_DERSI|nr:hypothetical protein HPB49_024913 [Dermacentor silvarum]